MNSIFRSLRMKCLVKLYAKNVFMTFVTPFHSEQNSWIQNGENVKNSINFISIFSILELFVDLKRSSYHSNVDQKSSSRKQFIFQQILKVQRLSMKNMKSLMKERKRSLISHNSICWNLKMRQNKMKL